MRPDPGSYALILINRRQTSVQVGRRRRLDTLPGYYVYVGSALSSGGVRARVKRHSRVGKPSHWHIDYIRESMQFQNAWCSYKPFNQEHDWADILTGMPEMTPIPGMGCSDCSCATHLFYCRTRPDFEYFIYQAGKPIECWRGDIEEI